MPTSNRSRSCEAATASSSPQRMRRPRNSSTIGPLPQSVGADTVVSRLTAIEKDLGDNEPTDEVVPASSLRKIAMTALAGTSIEFYDFFLYGTAAALVF